VGSVTVPVIEPVSVCPKAKTEKSANIRNTIANLDFTKVLLVENAILDHTQPQNV
jgi:hypothetical protein